MRDQYAGDITDLLKFSCIRTVVPPQCKLGVAWYYVPTHDGRRDGCHIEFHREEKWDSLDAKLRSELVSLGSMRSVSALERLKIWRPSTEFHREPVEYRATRDSWAKRMIRSLQSCDVIFADPDNGLSRDGVVSRKSATFSEISGLAREGRAVILIRFPSRNGSHDEQLGRHHFALAEYGPVTVRTCVILCNAAGRKFPRIRWFTLINPTIEMRKLVGQFATMLNSVTNSRAEVSDSAM